MKMFPRFRRVSGKPASVSSREMKSLVISEADPSLGELRVTHKYIAQRRQPVCA